MKRTAIIVPAALFLLTCLATRPAAAQVPFFGAGAGIFDPEIGVVQSGVLNDVQAVVSADRKYVTLTMRPNQAQLLSLNEFVFQAGNGAPQGLVGGAGAAAGNGAVGAGGGGGAGASAAGRGRSGRTPFPRTAVAVRAGVLDKPGMTLLGRAADRPAARAS